PAITAIGTVTASIRYIVIGPISASAAVQNQPAERLATLPVRPTSTPNATASKAVMSTAHPIRYAPVTPTRPLSGHAISWVSSIGSNAGCGYTHDSVMPTTAPPLRADCDHG